MTTFSFLPPSSLAEWLRNRRSAAAISQSALADCLVDLGGCTQTNISNWEVGVAIPDAGRLVGITRALGVTDPDDIALRDELAMRARRDSYARRVAAKGVPRAPEARCSTTLDPMESLDAVVD